MIYQEVIFINDINGRLELNRPTKRVRKSTQKAILIILVPMENSSKMMEDYERIKIADKLNLPCDR